MRRWGRIALWVLALLPSVTLALLTVQLLASLDEPWPTGYSVWSAEILIPAGTLLVSTLGTISIWLAWRKERRDSREYTLKWPAPGSEDTELGVLMELEGGHGETEVYARVQA